MTAEGCGIYDALYVSIEEFKEAKYGEYPERLVGADDHEVVRVMQVII